LFENIYEVLLPPSIYGRYSAAKQD